MRRRSGTGIDTTDAAFFSRVRLYRALLGRRSSERLRPNLIDHHQEDAVRHMILLKAAEDVGAPPPQLLEAMGAGIAQLMQDGVMLQSGALLPSTAGARVRLSGDRVSVTDGPFTEATELVGGYAIVEVQSQGQAVELATRLVEIHKDHWPGWQGEAEVRQLVEAAS